MTITVFESIGFSATHAISDMLRLSGQNYVSHGTRNYELSTNIGKNDQQFSEFLGAMIKLSGEYQHCLSVHSIFHPEEIRKAIIGKDVKFYGLMRRSQKNQILSCFYWAVDLFLNGRRDMSLKYVELFKKYDDFIRRSGLDSDLVTLFLIYAVTHVLQYNILLSNNCEKLYFMEDIISDPKKFITEIGVGGDSNAPINLKKGLSHKNKIVGFTFLDKASDVYDKLCQNMKFKIDGIDHSLIDLEDRFHQKASFNASV